MVARASGSIFGSDEDGWGTADDGSVGAVTNGSVLSDKQNESDGFDGSGSGSTVANGGDEYDSADARPVTNKSISQEFY